MMNADEIDIERIAEGLSDAMRAILIEIGTGKPREFTLGMSGFALIDRALVFVNELGARHLTDTGWAVRNHLKEQNNADV